MNTVYKWAEEYNIQFDAGKLETFHHQQTNKVQLEVRGLAGSAIPKLESVLNLGIHLSKKATSSLHFAQMTTIWSRVVGWIFKFFSIKNRDTMLLLSKTFALICLNFYSQLRSPRSVKLIAGLEVIQRNYTKKIDSMNHMGDREWLKKLRLYSLEMIRERHVVVYM